MLSIKQITDGFKNRALNTDGLHWGVLKFDMGKDGFLTIDGNKKPNEVSNKDIKSDCTIKLTMETLSRMITGDIESTDVDMKITGDLRVAMILGPAATDQPSPRMEQRAGDRGILVPFPSESYSDDDSK